MQSRGAHGPRRPQVDTRGGAAGGQKGGATALDSAFRMLARRSYTEAELRSRLERTWDSPSVTAALSRLAELRLIDDPAWAERFAVDRFERAGRGRHRILSELVARGIDAELAAAVVGRVIDPAREREYARIQLASLLGHRTGRTGLTERIDRGEGAATGDAGERELAAAFRRLVARGFPAGLIRDLLGGS